MPILLGMVSQGKSHRKMALSIFSYTYLNLFSSIIDLRRRNAACPHESAVSKNSPQGVFMAPCGLFVL